jgi:serine/threonine-protein kinase RsbW
MMTTDTLSLDQRIASDTRVGNAVVIMIVENMQRIGWSESELFGVHMALEEAIINAIKHGNKLAPEKQVHVEVEADSESFMLRVTDEGEGFDPAAVPDCTLDENLELGCGRGLMLMNHYMDEVRFNERGNSLEIRKAR